MGVVVFPAPVAGGKIQKKITLTSGTSWTVPTGVTDINVLLVGGGGGSSASNGDGGANGPGSPGNAVWSTLTTTPAASISYTIGAGGTAAVNFPAAAAGAGGSTTFTGATTATGGNGGKKDGSGNTGSVSFANNGGPNNFAGSGMSTNGNVGGAGYIEIEYWVQEI